MLRWWFEHIDATMNYGGQQWPRYLVWHPLDHIHWSLERPAPGGGAGEGARFRIVEAMGANPDHYVDSTETVEKLDDTGIRLVRRIGPITAFSLEHTWIPCGDHTHYFTEMNVGASGGLLARAVNAVVARVLSEATTEAWITHNIEEVGHLDHILPDLHAREA